MCWRPMKIENAREYKRQWRIAHRAQIQEYKHRLMYQRVIRRKAKVRAAKDFLRNADPKEDIIHKLNKKAYAHMYYEANKEQIKTRSRKWYHDHEERVREKKREYGKTHLEQHRIVNRKYYDLHKDDINKRRREKCQDRKEEELNLPIEV